MDILINKVIVAEKQITISVHRAPPHAPGIYFLFDGDEVVYVGQSSCNIRGRISDHMGNDSQKPFTHYGWIVLPTEEVQTAEDEAIMRYRPRHNSKYPGKNKRQAWERKQNG